MGGIQIQHDLLRADSLKMSHTSYNRQWEVAQAKLTDLLEIECPAEPPKPERDRIAAFQGLAVSYIKYIQIFRKLEECYDQIVHPQKRICIRHVLDGVMGRILEQKNNMVTLEFCEYHYFDDVLSDLKLTPADIEIPIPKYFLQENAKSFKEREKMMDAIITKVKPEKSTTSKQAKIEVRMSTDEAIRLIQIHERARQGRLRAKFMKEIRLQEERERQAASKGVPTIDKDEAATQIQKIWKGYYQRKQTVIMRQEELEFIGMKPAQDTPYKETVMFVADRITDQRRATQLDNEREYRKTLVTVKEKLREVEGPEMREGMQDQIRQWFIESRDATGKFPEFPTEDEGGSAQIFRVKDPAELEAEAAAKDEDKGKKGKKKGKSAKKDKKGGKGKGKGKGGDAEEDEGIVFDPSNFVPTISEVHKTYQDVWATRDESGNFSQKHDVELIKEQKRKEVEEEVRTQVDELMRQELKNLKLAVDREKGKKGKKGKSGKKSGKKKKGKKSGKKSG